MTYKSAKVYTGSEWVDLAVTSTDVWVRNTREITGTAYTLDSADAGKSLIFTNSSAITITVPPTSSVSFPIGETFTITPKGTGQITVAAGSGVTLSSLNSKVKSSGQYAELRLSKIAADEWLLSGDLTS
jgi:hypothetical protein